MTILISVVFLMLQILWFAIFARAIISWFPIDPQGPIVKALDAVTEPVLGPLRRVVPRIGVVDITPMVAIILIFVLMQVLQAGA